MQSKADLLQQARAKVANERVAASHRRSEAAARAAQTRANGNGQARIPDGWHVHPVTGEELRVIAGIVYVESLVEVAVPKGSDVLRKWKARPVSLGRASDVFKGKSAQPKKLGEAPHNASDSLTEGRGSDAGSKVDSQGISSSDKGFDNTPGGRPAVEIPGLEELVHTGLGARRIRERLSADGVVVSLPTVSRRLAALRREALP